MKTEFTVEAKVSPGKGRKYHRLELEIELPEELKDWQIVPAYLYGAEASLYRGTLRVRLRKRKNILNIAR